MLLRISDRVRFSATSMDSGLFNLRTIRHMWYDGVLVTMQQSGTHWLRYMLGLVLARIHDLPPPAYIQDRAIVGDAIYRNAPRITYTGMVPHYFLRSRAFFRLPAVPRHVILVRDLRDSLVSHYEKRKDDYDVDFSTYLRGDIRRKMWRTDIWTRIRFLNGWGAVVERQREKVTVLRYEDLRSDTRGELARICRHLNIKGVTPELLDEVVGASSKDEMAKLSKPNKKLKNVRLDPRPADEWYTDADRRLIAEVCRRYLKHAFGYRYW